MRTGPFLLFSVLLAGCQTASYEASETSPFYVVPPGSHLTLNQDLAIAPDQLGVYIQYGHAMPNTQIQHYYPFCKFELYHLSDSARTVAPDDITVTKTVQQEIEGAVAANGSIHYAAISAGPTRVAQMEGGYPPVQSFTTRMDLKSKKNPDIYRLTCATFGYPNFGRHVTIAEIRRAIEPLFTLRLPSGG